MSRVLEAVSAFAAKVTLARGRMSAVIALGAGALSALAMPPFSAWPVLFLTLPVAVWLIDGASGETRFRSARAAAVIGFLFGFGYFLAGLWWIGSAFLVDADVFGWLLPVAVAGLPALLALFHAFAFAVARLIWTPGWPRLLAFATALGLGELARGHLLTGFPWNSFGYALADQPWFGQLASVIGVEGLTYVALAVFVAPAVLTDPKPARAYLVTAVCTLVALGGFGAARLASAPAAFDDKMSIRVLQPEIPQDMKSQDSARDTIMDAYIALTDEARDPTRRGFADANLVVWPESAFPFLLSRTPEALARIGASLAPGAALVTGSVRGVLRADGSGDADFWNSVHVVGDDGSIRATYDKIHLVPFGEYLPFQSFLESIGLETLTRQRGGFATGDRRAVLTLPNGRRFRPLICYEAIFPEEVEGEERPDFLLNVTTDAWFGRTPGPYQHAAQARARTIEQGLPMVRSANGGISSIIDSYGRVVASANLGERGVVDGFLPLAIEPTVFVATHGLLHLAFPLVFLSLVLIGRRRV